MRYYPLKFMFCMAAVFLGCRNKGFKTRTNVYITPSDTVVVRETTATAGTYHIRDLTPEMKGYLSGQLQFARQLVRKYASDAADSPFDAGVLDDVLDNWRAKKGGKEKPDSVIEALGFAFGQGLVDSLHLQWQVWSDSAGDDLTVIDRKYLINAYPLASAERANTDQKHGSFQGVRTVIIEELNAAKKSGDVKERK
jgi:hypothetical protein